MERRSETIGELVTALCAAQAEMELAERDSANPYHQSKYSSLASGWKVARGPLSRNGLALLQLPTGEGQRVTMTTILAHKSGEWIACDLHMIAASASNQAVGSAITYGRRYGMFPMIGVASEDDDGEAAEGREKGTTKESAKAAQKKIADEKIRELKDRGGMKKAVPPEIPPPPEEALGVGAHDIADATLAQKLQASVDLVEKRKANDNAFARMVGEFQGLKEQCANAGYPECYRDTLRAFGVEHSNQFRDFETARQAYRAIAKNLSDLKGMEPPYEETEREAMKEQ